jgi:hypothetical protein
MCREQTVDMPEGLENLDEFFKCTLKVDLKKIFRSSRSSGMLTEVDELLWTQARSVGSRYKLTTILRKA